MLASWEFLRSNWKLNDLRKALLHSACHRVSAQWVGITVNMPTLPYPHPVLLVKNRDLDSSQVCCADSRAYLVLKGGLEPRASVSLPSEFFIWFLTGVSVWFPLFGWNIEPGGCPSIRTPALPATLRGCDVAQLWVGRDQSSELTALAVGPAGNNQSLGRTEVAHSSVARAFTLLWLDFHVFLLPSPLKSRLTHLYTLVP